MTSFMADSITLQTMDVKLTGRLHSHIFFFSVVIHGDEDVNGRYLKEDLVGGIRKDKDSAVHAFDML